MSVSRRGDAWRVQVYGPIRTDGKRARYYRTARTKREAVALEAALVAEVAAGTHAEPTRETTGRFLERWLGQHPLKDSSRARYRDVLDRVLLPALGHRPLASLRATDLVDLVAAWRAAGLAPRTIRLQAAILRGALAQAAAWRVVPFDPFTGVRLPPVPRREAATLAPAGLRAYVAGLDTLRPGERMALLLLAFGGLRISEALGLRWRDVRWAEGTVVVGQQWVTEQRAFTSPKSRAAERAVALPAVIVAALREHQTAQLARAITAPSWTDHDLVACREDGRPLDRNAVGRVHKRLLERLGLPAVRPHDLRHGHASLLLDAGVSVKEVSARLGHAKLGTTIETYLHRVEGADTAAAEAFARRVLEEQP